MYVVKLTKPPKTSLWKSDYFPRKVRYLTDAKAIKTAVEANGGEATIEKLK